uniref:Uncharacterized protein n=1 Tax=Rhizophora mucronata TaxID=61149 RepID=A0A2P2NA50_RHIMU
MWYNRNLKVWHNSYGSTFLMAMQKVIKAQCFLCPNRSIIKIIYEKKTTVR